MAASQSRYQWKIVLALWLEFKNVEGVHSILANEADSELQFLSLLYGPQVNGKKAIRHRSWQYSRASGTFSRDPIREADEHMITT
jgi:hypothetical protein